MTPTLGAVADRPFTEAGYLVTISVQPTTARSSQLRRMFAGSLIAAGAVSGLVGLAAPAKALPESSISSNCAMRGWSYGTIVRADGTRVSTCCPTGNPGEISGGQCSIYVDGTLAARTDGTSGKPPKHRAPVGPPTEVLERVN